jgi:hypothetical protein
MKEFVLNNLRPEFMGQKFERANNAYGTQKEKKNEKQTGPSKIRTQTHLCLDKHSDEPGSPERCDRI